VGRGHLGLGSRGGGWVWGGKGKKSERGGIYSFRENTRPKWGPTTGSRTRCVPGQLSGVVFWDFNPFSLFNLNFFYLLSTIYSWVMEEPILGIRLRLCSVTSE
jgi:hypothetical protein